MLSSKETGYDSDTQRRIQAGCAGLAIAYIAFRHRGAMLPSASCLQHEAKSHQRIIGHSINSFAILAIIFGLVASISQGVLLVAEGFSRQLNIGDSTELRIAVIMCMAACYMLSASTGIHRGIKLLSNVNMLLALSLMLFVLFAGPTLKLVQIFMSGVGDYINQFISLSFDSRPYAEDKAWISNWSVQYFLWWIAWAPFVGVFIARISRGRTIREFLLGVILVPSILSALWFAVFGGAALDIYEALPASFTDISSNADGVIFSMLATLPLSEVTAWVTLILVFIFLVTSADSGMYILAMFSEKGSLHPSLWQKLFWGSVIAGVAIFATNTGRSTDFFRAFAVTGAIPYMLIMMWQIVYTSRRIHADGRTLKKH